MNFYLIVPRLIHIGSGVFWAGAAVMIAAFLEPTVRAAGPEGGRFMQRLAAAAVVTRHRRHVSVCPKVV